MNNFKNFKLILSELGETITYELDYLTKKETIITLSGEELKKEEKILDPIDFANKIYEITNNTKNLKNKYINNRILDGTKIEIEIIDMKNETRKIICKNEFPSEVNKIMSILEIKKEHKNGSRY